MQDSVIRTIHFVDNTIIIEYLYGWVYYVIGIDKFTLVLLHDKILY